MPPSRFQMDRYQDSLVITLGRGTVGPEPQIHLGRDSVTVAELTTRLETLRTEGAVAKAIVLLQTDTGTPVGTEREITELVLSKGFRLAMVGKNLPAPPTPNPAEK